MQRLGIVVAGANGDDAEHRAVLAQQAHEAVDNLVDDAVAAQGDDEVVRGTHASGELRAVPSMPGPHDVRTLSRCLANEFLGLAGRCLARTALSGRVGDDKRFLEVFHACQYTAGMPFSRATRCATLFPAKGSNRPQRSTNP